MAGNENSVMTLARQYGSVVPAHYRVIVLEANGKIGCHDFFDLETARSYADDCASEIENGPVLSYVLQEDFAIIYQGSHYGAGKT